MPSHSYGPTVAERLRHPVSQWTEALQSFSKQLRVALPCVVKSFDPAQQTVTVLPVIHEEERIDGTLQTIELPELQDVPVLVPRAGNFVLTLPIQAGDECLVIFSDTCLDSWYQSGGRQKEFKKRRHALADGFAVFGPWSKPNRIRNYASASAQLRSLDGQTVIDVATSQVTVTANTVQVTAQTANVQASGTATLQGQTVNVTGSSAVHISGSGATTIEGKDFLHHTHSGVQAGGSVTGPVL